LENFLTRLVNWLANCINSLTAKINAFNSSKKAVSEPPKKKAKPIMPLGSDPRSERYFEALWRSLKPRQSNGLAYVLTSIKGRRSQYEAVSRETGVDWEVIGCLHLMEAALDGSRQILNGEPWDQVTQLVPKGLGPWESWTESAIFAIKKKGQIFFNADIPTVLLAFEIYNGTGYKSKGIHSPYLWAGSQHYTKGKYIQDGVYDPMAESQQIGVAVILKALGYGASS